MIMKCITTMFVLTNYEYSMKLVYNRFVLYALVLVYRCLCTRHVRAIDNSDNNWRKFETNLKYYRFSPIISVYLKLSATIQMRQIRNVFKIENNWQNYWQRFVNY